MLQKSPLLTAANLGFGYGSRPVLTDVSLQLHSGRLLAITGPNGSGKSTLLGLLAGYLKPAQGFVKLHGTVALVLQRPNLAPGLPLSARDAVAMGLWGQRCSRREATDRIRRALVRVGMAEHANVALTRLSGGQQQRVMVAQALVQEADVVLLDEPATGIDAQHRLVLTDLIHDELARGAAIGLVTHDAQSAARADSILDLAVSPPDSPGFSPAS